MLKTLFLGAMMAVGANAAAAVERDPVGDRWIPDPEEQFLLDLQIRDRLLGDGVRAYETPNGPCIVFGDFLTALDVPMKIDLEAQRASGWAFTEENRIDIDRATGSASYNSNREALSKDSIQEVPEGWCVKATSLERWFGLNVRPNFSGSMLLLESEAKLPIELAAERRRRAERLSNRTSFDMASLPQVKLPYEMWRMPAMDVVVAAGVTYSDAGGMRFDRNSAVYASGELAKMSFDARLLTGTQRQEGTFRFRAYRSDADGGLLGFLNATHFEIGDLDTGSTGVSNVAGSGRGAMVSNRPLRRLARFDEVSFEGELPAGWDAELYRNGQLLAFASPNAQGRYAFNDIELQYGRNEVEIILYGPQGQVRRRVEEVLVGDQQIPPGETWYFASVSQPERDLFDFGPRRGTATSNVRAQATLAIDHGIDQKTSVGFLAQSLLLDDERLTYAEGAVRRTVGNALIEATVALDSQGGQRFRARAVGELGGIDFGAYATVNNGFRTTAVEDRVEQEYGVSLFAPVKIGSKNIPLSGQVGWRHYTDGTSALAAATRLNMLVDRFNLTAELDWEKRSFAGPAPPTESLNARFAGSGRVGDVRLQGDVELALAGTGVNRAGISAYYSQNEFVAWDGGFVWEPDNGRVRARVAHIRNLDIASVAVTAEAATDGSVAAGFNLAFSLDAPRFQPTRTPLARTGSVHATVYRDDNDNGIRDSDEPLVQGAMLTTGHTGHGDPSDDAGLIRMAGLRTHSPVAIGVDTSALDDPTLVPRTALRVVTPRPGVAAEIEIGLVGSGEVEGMLLDGSGNPLEGVELLLVGADGQVAGRTRSEFDGYFLVEQLAYGTYRLVLADASATALGLPKDLGKAFTLDPDKPYLRLGTIVADTPRLVVATP
ncbi:carboxypeptidase-like regulatory domain-containing protein [Sphingomicrobium marinum]|uniref:carboxypeptidase-like regulatory domain-containing protein n=1 Tax=Sphingomicrobium marinum TaxID=1227950 RepID=UPI0022404D18|nr:carboxypeptidase-like regulatory domain-containing protein [Sphingomicrobium marinum]